MIPAVDTAIIASLFLMLSNCPMLRLPVFRTLILITSLKKWLIILVPCISEWPSWYHTISLGIKSALVLFSKNSRSPVLFFEFNWIVSQGLSSIHTTVKQFPRWLHVNVIFPLCWALAMSVVSISRRKMKLRTKAEMTIK